MTKPPTLSAEPSAPVPVVSPIDAQPPDADLIAVAGELRRLRAMHAALAATDRFSYGAAEAYAHCLALLAGEAKPILSPEEPVASAGQSAQTHGPSSTNPATATT